MPDLGLALGLVATIAILAAAGGRAGLPDPIIFALGGLTLALVPTIPQIALPPSLVLVVFLPPLIFAAAQDTSWAELRQDARPILVLAVGLVLVTMVAVAVVATRLRPGSRGLRRSRWAPSSPRPTPLRPRRSPTRFTFHGGSSRSWRARG